MRRVMAFGFLSLLFVTVLVSGLTVFAQALQGPRDRPSPLSRILSGNDIGFRMEGTDPRTGNPTGTWMIRIDGNWLEVGAIPSMSWPSRLTPRSLVAPAQPLGQFAQEAPKPLQPLQSRQNVGINVGMYLMS